MAKHTAPFHFDIVGSFLRPVELKEAREAFNNGNITREELTAVEDRLITDLIQKQKAAGLPVITDGEFRRAYWHLDFMWGFNGVKEIELERRDHTPERSHAAVLCLAARWIGRHELLGIAECDGPRRPDEERPS